MTTPPSAVSDLGPQLVVGAPFPRAYLLEVAGRQAGRAGPSLGKARLQTGGAPSDCPASGDGSVPVPS